MSKEGAKLEELSMIRNILMGQQMEEYQSRFKELGESLEKAQNLLSEELKALKVDHEARMDSMTQQFEQQLSELTQAFQQKTTEIETQRKADRNQLGQLLIDLGKELLEQ